ncbi:hypothetical protein D777_01476 [Marinobacter nitratireducens]|uniref:Uncharacterized protein n=1 Tax=Marinobacter nitratireducens TaxID=1137280 RepID=A0A072NFB2_9GAMM|nr:hypothetical protein [Marinobacter nitratireducens]KEF31790.1 hypothetical protein D777_01476 [Marinobacter nitratireducens]
MKKIVITTAIVFFSAMASANSGQADRINEARSYPNKSETKADSTMHCQKNPEKHTNIEREK